MQVGKSKYGVAQFISMDTNNLILCSQQIILEYFNCIPHWIKFDTDMGTAYRPTAKERTTTRVTRLSAADTHTHTHTQNTCNSHSVYDFAC